MNTIPRVRTRTTIAAAGLAAIVTTVAMAGSASAGAEPPRITVGSTANCSPDGVPSSLDVFYDDHVDGHVPQSAHEELRQGSAVLWTADELHQENGDYFNTWNFPGASGVHLDPAGTYTYSITIIYDDAVTQTQSTTIDLATACAASPSTGPSPVPDRFQLTEGLFGCGTANGGAFLEWTYGDYPDGHYAAAFSIDLLKDGAVVEHHTTEGGDPTSDGAIASFDSRPGVPDGRGFEPWFDQLTLEPASYSLSITVTYEDGATDKHVLTFDLDDRCDGRVNGRTAASPTTAPSYTTTVPGGTLPETGSSNVTWAIGALGGLLLTAGATLFAGGRRSRAG